jgi:uncharacterized repeat protein (TIGR01451 family)
MKRLLIPATALTILRKSALALLCCTALMVLAASAQTLQQIKADPGNNNPPPPDAILDLNGRPIPAAYQQYTVQFQAAIANTAITFAFRNDPSFTSFTNASVTDVTIPNSPGPNLLLNGNFSLGTVDSTPVDWTYANIYGATYGGIVQSGCGMPVNGVNGNCWYDGAVQAYDAISQTIATTVGDTYLISFYVTAGGGSTFSGLSTNGDITDTGGNGINVTVYAQAGLPPPPPPGETLTLTELGLGSGYVTDNREGGIYCTLTNGTQGGTCSASYPTETLVTLTATPASGSTFGGWGGACASFGTLPTCTLTMNSAQNASASFNTPGPTQAGTVMTGTETVFNFQGGTGNGGYNYNAELTSGPPVMAQVTAIPVVDQLTCNGIVNPTFPGAQCFVYDKGSATATPSPVMFELTCPGSPGGTCGTDVNPNFFATLGTDFIFTKALNPLFNSIEPLVGWLKGVGPDPLHPCAQYTNNNPPLFQSNQIGTFSLTGDPLGIVKGTSGGTGSCWLSTYNTPHEAPSVTIVAPLNGGIYQQNQVALANYTCAATGPYLTVASCSAIDTLPGGSVVSVVNGAQFDTATLGSHTFTATVVDSAGNTVSQMVTYTVVGAADVAILKLAPRKVRSGSKLTYLIGVGDFGPANAVNVIVNDPLPPNTTFLSASGTNLACSIVNGKFSCSTTRVPCAFAGGIVSCNAGTIMPFSLWFLNGAVIQITVQVTAPAGTLNNTATVSASNADPRPGNNSSTASTTVTTY